MMNIKIKGLDAAIKSVDTKAFAERQERAFKKYAVNVDQEAKTLAPVDEGALKRSIFFKVGVNGVTIGASADYAGYIEFGTRKFAAAYVNTLPAEWQQFAATLKGPGTGTFEQFVESLVRWVRMKGIGATYNVKTKRRDKVGKQTAATTDYATAYAIAKMIMINGIRPHPFMYPAVNNNLPQFYKDLGL